MSLIKNISLVQVSTIIALCVIVIVRVTAQVADVSFLLMVIRQTHEPSKRVNLHPLKGHLTGVSMGVHALYANYCLLANHKLQVDHVSVHSCCKKLTFRMHLPVLGPLLSGNIQYRGPKISLVN